ncbi:MAG: SDR family oxidoreductase [Candidatus Nanopelagicales bacterium]|nr:SDR family oxidoreductase [Candidatus Nanopelagicales bacterium]
MTDVTGRVAIITGGASGIGEATARLLASEGALVVIADVDDDRGSALAASIGATYAHLDVADEDNWARMVASVVAELGDISILVNNAGVAASTPIATASTADWNRVIAVNLTGTFFGMRAVAASMKAAGGGAIINTSSVAGLVGTPGISAYVASKWGIRGLTKSAAMDLGPDNIRVLSVHPGAIDTPMSPAGDRKPGGQIIPRWGQPEEVARMILFLAADATFSTGSEFVIDGGFTAR